MSDWRTGPLGSFIEFQRGIDITRAAQVVGDVPVVSSGGVSSYHNEAHSSGPGVVIGRKGTLGKAFYLPGPYWPHDTTLWVRDFRGSHPKFVYYFMSRFDVSWLDAGSANPTLNRNHLHPVVVTWPPPHEQQAIAEVLGALDDKIAANTALAASTWALMETEFRMTQAGPTRERSTLGAIVSLEYGKALPAGAREPGYVSVVGSGGVSGAHSRAIVDRSGVVVGRKGSAGSVHWVTGPHFPIDTTFYVREKDPTVSQPYIYFLLRTLRLDEMNNDSAVPGLNRSEALALPVLLPTADALGTFTSHAESLIGLAEALDRENRTLAATRDALLPQLMSGKLRVRDAERIAEDPGA